MAHLLALGRTVTASEAADDKAAAAATAAAVALIMGGDVANGMHGAFTEPAAFDCTNSIAKRMLPATPR